MRLRQWRRLWQALALGALGLGALGPTTLAPARARADGSDEPPGEHERAVKIGPQAVVIVNERGQARMYDDPSQQVPTCRKGRCLGTVMGVLAGFAFVTYERATIFVEGNGRGAPPVAPP